MGKAKRQRKKPSRGRPNASGNPSYVVDQGGEELSFSTAREAIQYAISELFPNSPPDAAYREKRIPLGEPGSGRFLTILQEVVPGDDPDNRREVYIEPPEPASSFGVQPPTEPVIRDDLVDVKYDVAVSFAGEQREYVEQVVERLADQGVVVFYDEHELANLWGRDLLDELVETYRSRAFRVLMFVSKEYAAKAWPTQERRASLERMMHNLNEPYVLLVRFDDTTVPGIPGTTHFLDARTRTAVEIVDMTMEHLRQSGRDVAPPPSQRDMAERVSVRAIPGRTARDGWEVPYDIHNGSDYPITNTLLVIDDPGQPGRPEDQIGASSELVIGTVGAGETMSGRIDDAHFHEEPAFAKLTAMAVLLFTDHWGNHWAANRAGLVRRKHPSRIC